MNSQDNNRPTVTEYKRPEHINDYPTGPSYTAGHLSQTNASWRTFRPEINLEVCIGCYKCYMACPDGVIYKIDPKKVEIDFDYCKGCGVCANECPVDAIKMIKEEI